MVSVWLSLPTETTAVYTAKFVSVVVEIAS